MRRVRSRPQTEENFQDAVVALICDSGFEKLGINTVAQKAGADKVLIYRYFGNLNGLLSKVASDRNWLPDIEILFSASDSKPESAEDLLIQIQVLFAEWFESNTAASVIMNWRAAVKNPLTEHMTYLWRSSWIQLIEISEHSIRFPIPKDWKEQCLLLMLTIDAEIRGEPVSLHWPEAKTEPVVLKDNKHLEDHSFERLPTNLL